MSIPSSYFSINIHFYLFYSFSGNIFTFAARYARIYSETKDDLKKGVPQMATNIVYLPQQDDSITISRSELQNIVAQAVQDALSSTKKKRHMTREERKQAVSSYKEDGSKKATAAVPLKDTKDIKAVRDYFLSSGQIREYAIFSVGITLGVRASDLLDLQVKDILTPAGQFRDRLDVVEMKTSKRNRPLLTDYAKQALELYFKVRKNKYSPEDSLFITNQGSSCSLSFFNRKLREAGEALNLRLSSHTMRHTFSYLMSTQTAGATESNVDYMSLFVTQMAMNHSSISQTLSYTGLTQDMMDERRKAVSHYLLENTWFIGSLHNK